MPEQRGREHHRKRIGETLKEEIGTMLEGELGRSQDRAVYRD